jgi:hypothetical protein
MVTFASKAVQNPLESFYSCPHTMLLPEQSWNGHVECVKQLIEYDFPGMRLQVHGRTNGMTELSSHYHLHISVITVDDSPAEAAYTCVDLIVLKNVSLWKLLRFVISGIK